MADTQEWGLTEQGFRRPSYAEILDAFEYQAREKFTKDGKAPDLTVRSPLGLILRIQAWVTNLLFMLLEDVYNSRFADTAVGASLFLVGRNLGLQLLPAQRSGGYIKVTGTPGVTVPAGHLFGTNGGIIFAVQLAGVIGADGTVTLPVLCTEYGPAGNVPEGTVTRLITPTTTITAVTNEEDIQGGRDRETSEQFRDRYYRSVDPPGGVNADALQAYILQKVEGVLAVRVYENEYDVPDARGLPPHSLEAVVYGALDHAVAQAVYDKKGGGIQTYGNSVVEIISPQNGQVYEIRFTRPSGVAIWIRLTDVVTDPQRFPSDGIEQLQAAYINYIGGDLTGGLNIGVDVIYNKINCVANSIPGVEDFHLAIGTDGSTYSADNIAIDDREKAVTAPGQISIILAAQGGEGQP